MAKRPSKTGTEQARQIGASKLVNLLKARKQTKNDSKELGKAFRKKIANAAKSEHLNKKAFATLGTMSDMNAAQLNDYWDSLQYYVDVSGLADRARSAPRLKIDDDRHKDEDDASPKTFKDKSSRKKGGEASGNVTAFPAPTKEAAE